MQIKINVEFKSIQNAHSIQYGSSIVHNVVVEFACNLIVVSKVALTFVTSCGELQHMNVNGRRVRVLVAPFTGSMLSVDAITEWFDVDGPFSGFQMLNRCKYDTQTTTKALGYLNWSAYPKCVHKSAMVSDLQTQLTARHIRKAFRTARRYHVNHVMENSILAMKPEYGPGSENGVISVGDDAGSRHGMMCTYMFRRVYSRYDCHLPHYKPVVFRVLWTRNRLRLGVRIVCNSSKSGLGEWHSAVTNRIMTFIVQDVLNAVLPILPSATIDKLSDTEFSLKYKYDHECKDINTKRTVPPLQNNSSGVIRSTNLSNHFNEL